MLNLCFQAAAVGVGAGGVIGLFRWCCVQSDTVLHAVFFGGNMWMPASMAGLGALLLALALISGWLVHRFPQAGGSGIPLVELSVKEHRALPWRKALLAKFGATWCSIAGGLSVGREGPCIFMGSCAGSGLAALWRADDVRAREFIIGGAVAGLSAAFSAPLGGLLFAFEEMRCERSLRLVTFAAVASAIAYLMVLYGFGYGQVFAFGPFTPLPWTLWWVLAPIGLLVGLLAVGYNSALLRLVNAYARCTAIPPLLRHIPAFACAGLCMYVYPQVIEGFGPEPQALAGIGWALGALCLLFALKLGYSVVSFAAGVAGGLLMPILLMGSFAGASLAAVGADAAPHAPALIVACMSGFFAGSVRAPLTGAALVLEMCGAWVCLPEILIVTLFATMTGEAARSTPVYAALRQRVEKRIG